jgi:hypothetical protein
LREEKVMPRKRVIIELRTKTGTRGFFKNGLRSGGKGLTIE